MDGQIFESANRIQKYLDTCGRRGLGDFRQDNWVIKLGFRANMAHSVKKRCENDSILVMIVNEMVGRNFKVSTHIQSTRIFQEYP